MTIVCAKELGKLVMLKYLSALPFLIPHLDPVVKPCSGPKHVYKQALQIQEVHPRPRSNAYNFFRFYLFFHTCLI